MFQETSVFMLNTTKDDVYQTASTSTAKISQLWVRSCVLYPPENKYYSGIMCRFTLIMNHWVSVRHPGLFQIRRSASCAADSDSPDKNNGVLMSSSWGDRPILSTSPLLVTSCCRRARPAFSTGRFPQISGVKRLHPAALWCDSLRRTFQRRCSPADWMWAAEELPSARGVKGPEIIRDRQENRKYPFKTNPLCV